MVASCNELRISLTKGCVAIVDADLFESPLRYEWKDLVSETFVPSSLTWCVNSSARNRYAVTHGCISGIRRNVRLHRLLMEAPANLVVDHINGDTLDNRRVNLRVCTMGENRRNSRAPTTNTSGFKGVRFDNRGRLPWLAKLCVNYKYIHIGTFATVEEAARAYDRAALEHFGEYARLNFPVPHP
jgi:hypothetical protein